jgi:hypothetical protein
LRADKFVKRFNAILFSFFLVWAQLLAAPMPACSRQPARACCHCGGKMSCCAAQPSPCSQSAPAVPAPSGIQNQFLLPASVLITWSLPENEAGLISSAFVSPLTATGVPLYARDCARLI